MRGIAGYEYMAMGIAIITVIIEAPLGGGQRLLELVPDDARPALCRLAAAYCHGAVLPDTRALEQYVVPWYDTSMLEFSAMADPALIVRAATANAFRIMQGAFLDTDSSSELATLYGLSIDRLVSLSTDKVHTRAIAHKAYMDAIAAAL